MVNLETISDSKLNWNREHSQNYVVWSFYSLGTWINTYFNINIRKLSKLHSPPLKDVWITLPSPFMLKYTLSSLEK